MVGSKEEKNKKEKIRKGANGPVRNRVRTENKLRLAVGKVFSQKGYKGLTIKAIAAEAGVNYGLIYSYVGSVGNLIKSYFDEVEFCDPFKKQRISDFIEKGRALEAGDIFNILHDQLDSVLYNNQFQNALHWELSEKDNQVGKIASERDLISKRLMQRSSRTKNFAK